MQRGTEQRRQSEKQASAEAQVARDSRVSLRRVAALGALLALCLAAAGGWATALSGGLGGPVAGPLALHLPGDLASGAAGGLPAVIAACREQATAFRERGRRGRRVASEPRFGLLALEIPKGGLGCSRAHEPSQRRHPGVVGPAYAGSLAEMACIGA